MTFPLQWTASLINKFHTNIELFYNFEYIIIIKTKRYLCNRYYDLV